MARLTAAADLTFLVCLFLRAQFLSLFVVLFLCLRVRMRRCVCDSPCADPHPTGVASPVLYADP